MRSTVENHFTGNDNLEKFTCIKFASSKMSAPACHRRPSTAQIDQRIPLRNAKQQTNIPPRNERSTRKLASLTSAKRSVVTSDATGTHSNPPSPYHHITIDRDSLGTNSTVPVSKNELLIALNRQDSANESAVK